MRERKTIRLQHKDYMAGTNLQRAEDINAMFPDTEVKAIVCALGGAVAIRALRYLDYGLIRKNPRIFIDMSDITTLHIAFLAKEREVAILDALKKLGFRLEYDESQVSQLIDLKAKIDKCRSTGKFEDAIANIEDLDFLSGLMVKEYADLLSMPDEAYAKQQEMRKRLRGLLISLTKK